MAPPSRFFFVRPSGPTLTLFLSSFRRATGTLLAVSQGHNPGRPTYLSFYFSILRNSGLVSHARSQQPQEPLRCGLPPFLYRDPLTSARVERT